MAKRLVPKQYCDRCPVTKAKPATHIGIPFGFGEHKWKIDLCDQHYDMLSRDFFAWGLLAEEIEEAPTRFSSGYVADLRRAAEIREREAELAREAARYEPLGVEPPWSYDQWYFTDHAIERMNERFVDPVDVLWACVRPTFTRPASRPGDERSLVMHIRDDTKVVLDPKTQTIVTVAFVDISERKAVGL